MVAISTYCITLSVEGAFPPANIPRVGEDVAPTNLVLAASKSPKSVAFPVDAIVTKSITFDTDGAFPGPNTPLVELATAVNALLPVIKSPKSAASSVWRNSSHPHWFETNGRR